MRWDITAAFDLIPEVMRVMCTRYCYSVLMIEFNGKSEIIRVAKTPSVLLSVAGSKLAD